MKLYTLIFLFKKELEVSLKYRPESGRYITIAYNAVITKLKSGHNIKDTITKSNIALLDITDYMKNKLVDLLDKKLTMTEAKKLKQSLLFDELTSVIGIGHEKAKFLIKLGLVKSSQLTQKKYKSHLPDSVIMLMKYKPEKLIPHSGIKKIESKLTGFKGAKSKIVGGYLRKNPHSKDIDVMLVSGKPNILDKYINYLQTQFNNVRVYAHGKDKVSLVILVTKDAKRHIYYKVDVFRSSPKTQYSMLLYSTGSKQFNIRMRGVARKKGYLLNQNGLFKLDKNGKSNKTPIPVKSEKDFFRILGMKYVLPENR
jgi:DNA polymerase/3'-5' exonuclease PolX